MGKLPCVLVGSVIRGSYHEVHGALYLVDMEAGTYQAVLHYDDPIDWGGRGGYRGLRGICFHGEHIYVATSRGLLMLDREFRRLRHFENPYVIDCHEIFLHDGLIYLTATKTDSIVTFDIKEEQFVQGICLRRGFLELGRLSYFDPNDTGGPKFGDTVHLNNVFVEDGRIFVSGARSRHLLCIEDGEVHLFAVLPRWNHNCRPFRDGLLYNDTRRHRVVFCNSRGEIQAHPVVRYNRADLVNDTDPQISRQGFARGLCTYGDLLVGGSTPATVSVYRLGVEKAVRVLNITMDVRNTIHGLALIPATSEHVQA